MRRSISESNERKAKKVKLATEHPRDWLDVPSDIMANILQRIGLVEILENARKVCTTWCGICKHICKDPAMWRVIYVDAPSLYPGARRTREETCKYVLEKNQGHLVDLTVVNSHDSQLLSHVAERSSQLKRLVFACCGGNVARSWKEVCKEFTLLEELSFFNTAIGTRGVYKACKFCPFLTTLKLNRKPDPYLKWNENFIQDGIARTIGESLPGLRHLELIGNNMSDYGLELILDGCPHLELLDLRGCFYIKLKGPLRKRLLQTIKNLKRPRDSLEGCPYIHP